MSFPFYPYQPFPKPVRPPRVENLGDVCLSFDAKWIPYLLGAVTALTAEQTYDSDQVRAIGEARNLLDLFLQAKACPTAPVMGVEGDDCMSCCLRWSDAGILQVFSCGVWVDVPGPGSKLPITGGAPAQGTPQPAAGQCENFIGKVLFFGRWLLPVPVSSGDQITVTNALGASTDYIVDTPEWRCGDGLIFIAGGCVSGTAIPGTGDPMPSANHANLIGTDGTNFFDFGQAANGVPVTITIPPGVSDANFAMLINSAGPAGAGDITFDIRICKNTASPISLAYVFGTGPAGVSVGEVFTVNSTHNGVGVGSERMDIQFTPCCHVTILSSSGWVSAGSTGSPGYDDCAHVNHNHSGADIAPELQAANTAMTEQYLNSLNGSPFSIQMRVDSVP